MDIKDHIKQHEILDVEDIGFNDNRYVNTTGDTMTGGLSNLTSINPLTTLAESWIGPSSTTGIYFKGGKIGIGTISPTQKLDVNGSMLIPFKSYYMAKTSEGTPLNLFGFDTGRNLQFGSGGADLIHFDVGGTGSRMVINATGNVGIGTTAPGYKLDVAGSIGIKNSLLWTSNDVIAYKNSLYPSIYSSSGSGSAYPFTGTSGNLVLEPRLNGAVRDVVIMGVGATPIAVFQGSGNVGIGTSNPTKKLDINGKIAINGQTTIYNANALGTGTGSLFIGNGGNNNTATYNTSIGINALEDVTSGGYNTGIGYNSLLNVTTGTDNVGIGFQTLIGITSGSKNFALGTEALRNNTGNNNMGLGYNSLRSNKAGNNGVAVGYESQTYANDTTTPWTNQNTSIGYQSLRGSTTAANNTGNYNTAIGYQTLMNDTTGEKNMALGSFALLSNTTGSYNVAQGMSALRENTAGKGNLALGFATLLPLNNGSYNTSIGNESGRYYNGTTGNLTSANNSIFLGASASALANSGDNEIVIGYNTIGKGSNTAVIGNADITDVYLSSDIGATVHAGKFKLGALNTAPASASDTGTQGEIRLTADAIYFCIATDTWVKTTLASW